LPRLRTEDPSLNSRALTWTVSAAAGVAFASFAGLIGRWSANPALGWSAALAAAGLGRAAASRAGAADEERARVWAAAGALAALAVPALLRALGLSLASETSFLQSPLGGAADAAFVLGQAGLLAALAAGAWSLAARGAGAGGAAAALAGAAAAALAVHVAEPELFLAAAALAVLAAAEFLERPWTRRESAPLRARAFGLAAALGLALASFAPNLLITVWMARLHAAYPGGGYLAAADDGTRLWTAYRFSNGAAMMLRDGVPQISDPATTRLALLLLLGQRDAGTTLLLARPPDALIALTAQGYGAMVTIADESPAETAVLDALGGGREWRRKMTAPGPAAPNAALIFLPAPPSSTLRRLTGPGALKALRARLADDARVGILLPPGATARDVDEVSRSAASAFGAARVADLPKGVLVMASSADILTDLDQLSAHVWQSMAQPISDPATILDGAQWRSAPPAK
jgi:hypothetical protein